MRLSPVEFAALFDGLDWTRVQTTKGICLSSMRKGTPPRRSKKITLISSRICKDYSGRQKTGKYLPFRVSQIAWITQIVPVMFGSSPGGPHQWFQDKSGLISQLDNSVFKPLPGRFETASKSVRLDHMSISTNLASRNRSYNTIYVH
jgi:hypothetical protein